MLRNIRNLIGYSIHATDGDLGKVDDLLFDDQKWAVRYLIVNCGGWLVRKKVMISPLSILRIDRETKRLDLNLTQQDLERSPDLDLDTPVSRQKEAEFFRYYRWPYYWTGAGIWGSPAAPESHPVESTSKGPFLEQTPSIPRHHKDSHLRSVKDVTGYRIHSPDGEFGHVEDFVAEDRSWAIRYAVVDTKNWLPSKSTLIAPEWITKVSWLEKEIYLDLPKDIIQEAPEYEVGMVLSREYEHRLYEYYGREGYWHQESHRVRKIAS